MDYNAYWKEIKTLPKVVNNFVFADRTGLQYTKIAYGNHPQQYMLFCPAPQEAPKRNEFIYFIHGGGWRFGKPERYIPAARLFCHLGYDVILTTHRRVPKYQSPHIHEDTFLSFDKAGNLASLKEKQAIVIGISAGGNLGGLLIYDRLSLSKIGQTQSRFKGFVSVAGAMDLHTFPDTFALRSYTGKWGSEQFLKANPTNYLQSGEQIPVLCIHGDDDGIVPYHSSISFIEKLLQNQCPSAELYQVKGGKHFQTTTEWWLQKSIETEVVLDWIEKTVNKKPTASAAGFTQTNAKPKLT